MLLAASMLALWLASSVLAAAAFAAWVALGGHGGVALADVAGVLGLSSKRSHRPAARSTPASFPPGRSPG
jgi:hypothetical protein